MFLGNRRLRVLVQKGAKFSQQTAVHDQNQIFKGMVVAALIQVTGHLPKEIFHGVCFWVLFAGVGVPSGSGLVPTPVL